MEDKYLKYFSLTFDGLMRFIHKVDIYNTQSLML